jgi:hypothetical protein
MGKDRESNFDGLPVSKQISIIIVDLVLPPNQWDLKQWPGKLREPACWSAPLTSRFIDLDSHFCF